MAITREYRIKLYGQNSGLVCASLVTLTHPTEGTVRISTDNADVLSTNPQVRGTISRGESYQWAPVDLILPLDEAQSDPVSRIAIANVDRRLVPYARSIPGDITATFELIDPADPDTVQRDWPDLEVVSFNYDALECVVGLRVDLRQHLRFPKGSFTPAGFSGLFR